MPIYTYKCSNGQCGSVTEDIGSHAQREYPRKCRACDAIATYEGLNVTVTHTPRGVAAIMADGARVPGRFNKSAPMRKRRTQRV